MLLTACNVTDTGNPNEGGPAGGLYCDETSSVIELTDDAALGFSAADVQDFLLAEHQALLAWLDAELVTVNHSGESQLSIEVTAIDEVRLVRSKPKEGGVPLADGPSVYCTDHLVVDAALHIQSADGALDEHLTAALRIESSDFVFGQVTLPADSLAGALELSIAAPEGFVADGPEKLSIDLGFARFGMTGALSANAQYLSADGQVGASMGGRIAQWPTEGFCGVDSIAVPVDAGVRGVSIEQAISDYNDQSSVPVDFEPSGESSTLSLTLSLEGSTVCQNLAAPPGLERPIAFSGTMSVLSENGTLDGLFAVEAEARPRQEGAGLSINLSSSFVSDDPSQFESLPARLGITEPVSIDGYDAGAVWFVSDNMQGLHGFFVVNGLTDLDCVSEPDPGGMGAPGCMGSQVTELFSGTF